MDKKYVYEFNEGDETMRELLGGKKLVTNIMKIMKQLMMVLKLKSWNI